ncbi:hypothetical protein [Aureivirga sp. CE67]|uniref:hypothetical protein n=1 Tax=Aureivirga sp. CE67 TaxID=1788983 RepID=UPI0018CABA5B|nr:hypothetical protein [Aureivirga sp. CE67]
MKIELYPDMDERDNEIEYLEYDIDENAPIKELFDKIHEEKNIPRFKEFILDENQIEKIPCEYYIKSNDKSYSSFQFIDDLDQKISEFQKNGNDNSLSLMINQSIGFVN